MKAINKIVFIGAGNVATHLATNLKDKRFDIVQVYSRKKKSADFLAKKVDAESICNLNAVSEEADLYIIAVPDDALPEIAGKLKLENKLIVHTSGFHEMDILKSISARTGVFYPLQTFSKNRKINLSDVPFCIESKNINDIALLKSVAQTLSSDIRLMNSGKRRMVHLAAVFACNFANHMYFAANEILEQSNISFDILKPLIIETAAKIIKQTPEKAQTGPAYRGDVSVMKQHLKILKDKDIIELYKLMSDHIYKTHHSK
jgi:predicted short-subunit dehydrogenase-like oxidoreductase (DUF2520 family)